MTRSSTPAQQPAADAVFPRPLGGDASKLLDRLGLAATSERDAIADAVDAYLDPHGLAARVHSLRYGRLTLAASPTDAHVLRYHLEALRSHLTAATGVALRSVLITTRNRPTDR